MRTYEHDDSTTSDISRHRRTAGLPGTAYSPRSHRRQPTGASSSGPTKQVQPAGPGRANRSSNGSGQPRLHRRGHRSGPPAGEGQALPADRGDEQRNCRTLQEEREAEQAERQRLAEEADAARGCKEERRWSSVTSSTRKRERVADADRAELSSATTPTAPSSSRSAAHGGARATAVHRIEQEAEFILPELRDFVAGTRPRRSTQSIEEMKARTESDHRQLAAARPQPQPVPGGGDAIGPTRRTNGATTEYEQLTPEDIKGDGHGHVQALPATTPTGRPRQHEPTYGAQPYAPRSQPWPRSRAWVANCPSSPASPVRPGSPRVAPTRQYDVPVRLQRPATGWTTPGSATPGSVTTGSTMMGPAIQTIWSQGDPVPVDASSPVRAVRREEDGTGHHARSDRQLHALQQPPDARRVRWRKASA